MATVREAVLARSRLTGEIARLLEKYTSTTGCVVHGIEWYTTADADGAITYTVSLDVRLPSKPPKAEEAAPKASVEVTIPRSLVVDQAESVLPF